MRIDLGWDVRVKLNEVGYSLHRFSHYLDALRNKDKPFEYVPLPTDPQGRVHMPLWQFMYIYGQHVKLGPPYAFDLESISLAPNANEHDVLRPEFDIGGLLTFSELRQKNVLRCKEDFGHDLSAWTVAEWGNAAAGEMGEACNVAKKMLRFRDGVRGNQAGKSRDEYRKDLASEIAGCLIYLDLWAASEGLSLAQIVKEEFNAKSDEIGSEVKL